MSRLFVVLEHRGVHLLLADTAARAPQWAPRAQWVECDPERPDESRDQVHAAIQALNANSGSDLRASTIIVGLPWLDIGEAALPPVDATSQRQLLRRERDRYFVFDEPAAVTLVPSSSTTRPALALACRATWLAEWREVLAAHAPTDTVIAAPLAVAQALGNGEWIMPSEAQDVSSTGARIVVQQHRLVQVRRHEAESRGPLTAERKAVEWTAVVRGLLMQSVIPADLQLADEAAEAAWRRERVQTTARRVGITVALMVALIWMVDTWRDRRLASLERDVAALTDLTAPVRAARERRDRALVEQSLLSEDASSRPRAPLRVLDRIAEILPRDAFVQRAEWDGSLWRIDGSALDAAALVPRLDAEPAFSGVRSLAPSTRFLDGGRQRSSFSIGFGLREAPRVGGAQ